MTVKKRPPLAERPMVSEYTYDENVPEEQRLVYRPMDDDEYDDLLVRQKAYAKAQAEPVVHPLVAQISSMSDEDKAALAAALKGA